MSKTRGHEVATIDCSLITINTPGNPEELILDTANQIQVTPQIETIDAIKLIIKGILRAQKPVENVLTGNTIVLTDNVFIPQLVKTLQGGTITFNSDGTLKSYSPPPAGSKDNGDVFFLNAYTAIYNAAGIITGYEKIKYPNCKGVPISLSSQDGVFRVSSYTINSAPELGQVPYDIEWIKPDELPVAEINPNELAPVITSLGGLPGAVTGSAYSHALVATGRQPITWAITSGALPDGLNLLSSGVISGTPTATETAAFTAEASNGILPNATKDFTLDVM